MAKLPGAFKADEDLKMDSFDPLPPSDYHLRVKETDMARNKNDTGDLIKIRFEVVDGEYKGRLLFLNINYTHQNATAEEIGQKMLNALILAAGLPALEDTDDLLGCEVMGKVTVTKGTAQYAASNEIKNFKPAEGIARPSKPSSDKEAPPVKKRKVTFGD